MSSFHFHTCGPRYHHSLISLLHAHWWENEQGVEVVEQAKVLSYIPIRLQQLRWDMTSVTYRRKGCKCHKCSSHLQRGISQWLVFTRAKLCWTFINIKVLEKKLVHHSSSDYCTCSIEAPGSLLGVQCEKALFDNAQHSEKWRYFHLWNFNNICATFSGGLCFPIFTVEASACTIIFRL